MEKCIFYNCKFFLYTAVFECHLGLLILSDLKIGQKKLNSTVLMCPNLYVPQLTFNNQACNNANTNIHGLFHNNTVQFHVQQQQKQAQTLKQGGTF